MYTRVESRFWQDEKMRLVSSDARHLMLYLLTSPHRNILGMYFLPIPYACFDLGWDEHRFGKGLSELLGKGCIKYDEENHVVLVINFLKHNPLENQNQVKSAVDKLEQLPQTPLIKDLYEIVKDEKPHYKQLVERLDKQLSKGLSEQLNELFSKQEEVKEEEKETEEEKEYNTAADAAKNQLVPAEKSSGSQEVIEDDGAQPKKTGKDEYTQEFEEFWSNYPRKLDKRRAFKAWKARLKEGTDPLDIIQAGINYANYCKKQGFEQRFIKHGSTFLGPDKSFLDFVDGLPEIPEQKNGPHEPKSWDALRVLYSEYEEEEGGVGT